MLVGHIGPLMMYNFVFCLTTTYSYHFFEAFILSSRLMKSAVWKPYLEGVPLQQSDAIIRSQWCGGSLDFCPINVLCYDLWKNLSSSKKIIETSKSLRIRTPIGKREEINTGDVPGGRQTVSLPMAHHTQGPNFSVVYSRNFQKEDMFVRGGRR